MNKEELIGFIDDEIVAEEERANACKHDIPKYLCRQNIEMLKQLRKIIEQHFEYKYLDNDPECMTLKERLTQKYGEGYKQGLFDTDMERQQGELDKLRKEQQDTLKKEQQEKPLDGKKRSKSAEARWLEIPYSAYKIAYDRGYDEAQQEKVKVTNQCHYCEAKLIPTISKWGEQFEEGKGDFNCPKCGARLKIQELSVEVCDE